MLCVYFIYAVTGLLEFLVFSILVSESLWHMMRFNRYVSVSYFVFQIIDSILLAITEFWWYLMIYGNEFLHTLWQFVRNGFVHFSPVFSPLICAFVSVRQNWTFVLVNIYYFKRSDVAFRLIYRIIFCRRLLFIRFSQMGPLKIWIWRQYWILCFYEKRFSWTFFSDEVFKNAYKANYFPSF